MINRFAGLEIKSPEEKYEVIFIEITSELLIFKNLSQDFNVHDLKDESDIKLALDIFCLLKELHETQLYVINVWRRYKCGDITLSAATVITNLVMALAA
jgi:hypothetical protein